MIPDSFKQDLLNRVDLVDVVQRYVQLRKAGANYVGLCPFHNEKTPSFSVSPAKQFYHCFGCGVHGNAIGFLMAYASLGYVEAVKDLASQAGMQVPELQPRSPEEAARKEREPDLYALMEQAMDFFRAELKKAPRAIDYLKKRGLTGEIAARYRMGYAPDDWQGLKAPFPKYEDRTLVELGLVVENEGKRYDRFRDRIMFPIQNARGVVIGFGGRILDKGEPKYMNSPETPLFEKGREIYGLVQARDAVRAAGRVLVVEGYMDVVALAQFDVGYAVATLGTATTPVHVSKLLRLADEVVFCFDGDAAGRKAAWRALEVSLAYVQDQKPVRFLFLPDGEDPDTYIRRHGKERFEEQVHQADTLSQYLLAQLRSECNPTTPEGRARFGAVAVPQVEKITAPHLKRQLFAEVARIAELTVEELLQKQNSHQSAGFRQASPPRAKRPPPSSPEWKLLSRVAVYPALATEIDPSLMDSSLEESRVIVEMAKLSSEIDSGQISPAWMIEKFQNTPHERLFFEAQAYCFDLKESETEGRAYVRHILEMLDVARKREQLKAYEERLGRGQLSKDELVRYTKMISEVKALEQRLQSGGRQAP